MLEVIGKGLYYLLFYLVLAGIILSFCKKTKGERELLGREAGKELRGIAILMVLLGHLSYMVGYVKLPVTPALGAPAVDIFLFLSAFGLMSSYEKKGLKGFVGRRLAVILIPYVIATLLKIPFMQVEGWGIKEVILNILPLTTNITIMLDTSMWYVQYILLCYLVFFLVFKIPGLNQKQKTLILVLAGAGLTVFNGSLYYGEKLPAMNSLSESYSHHLSFPLGAVFYLVYEKAKKVSWKKYLGVAAAAFILFQLIAFPGIDGYVKYYMNNLAYVVFFVAVFAVLKHFGLQSKLLQWMGDLAYYIYLNELIVIGIFFRMVPLPGGINGLLIMIVSIAAAIPVKYLSEWILKKIKVRT